MYDKGTFTNTCRGMQIGDPYNFGGLKNGGPKNKFNLPPKIESIWFSVGLTHDGYFPWEKRGPRKIYGPKRERGGGWKFFKRFFFLHQIHPFKCLWMVPNWYKSTNLRFYNLKFFNKTNLKWLYNHANINGMTLATLGPTIS